MQSYGGGGAPMRRRRVIWWPLVLFALYAGYYYLTNQETVPITGRTQLVDMSREQEAALGLQSYQQILSQENVIQSGKVVDVVRTIGQRLATAAAPEDPGFEWEYNVIQSDQANAFALPGGKVAVYTGIVPIAQNADGLAIVMGHEIAHAIARHGAERIAHQKLVQLGTMAAGMAMSDMDQQTQHMVMGALGVGTQFGVLLPFSRDHESEADRMGLIFAARACFDPREAPKLWERMASAGPGGQPAEFMSTHPSHETRIRNFEAWMPEALQIRAESCPDKPLPAQPQSLG
ncbi:MAG: M48 family metallopeptidase [Deltaproteobacteria bacterium]|nr:M48 family metallopeptidase [Deltaproteobacteria bacterium]